jgi:tetratricopeptide (TPR) repeat protein
MGCNLRSLGAPVWAALVAFALIGCGAGAANAPETLAQLRLRASASPKDASAQRALAFGELFDPAGDPRRTEPSLERALALSPDDVELWLARGLQADVRGHTTAALDAYLTALDRFVAAPQAFAPQLGELVLAGVSGLEGGAPSYVTKVKPALERALAASGLPAPTRYLIGTALIDLAFRAGDRATAQALAARVGCVTEARVAGPFGPYVLLGFDQKHAAAPGTPLAERYELGVGRGVWPTRTLGSRGCVLNVGGGPIAEGGVSFVQSTLTASEAGSYLLRLHTASHTAVFIDGREVLRVDGRRALVPDVSFAQVELTVGQHELTVELAARHPNPMLALSLMKAGGRDVAAVAMPELGSPHGMMRYLRAAIALGRGDALAARSALSHIRPEEPASPLMRLQRASLLLADPLLPGDEREDEARRQLIAALKTDADLWGPAVQLANMMAGNGRITEAITAMREAHRRFPEVPGVGLSLAGLLRQKGWDAEADQVIAALRKRVPDGCSVLSAQLEALRSRQREEQAARLVDEMMRCEGQANARYSQKLRERDWPGALAELDRLESLEPPQGRYAWLLARMELAKNRSDDATVERTLSELRASYPRSSTAAVEAIDRQAGRGDLSGALATLQQEVTREPATMADLYRLAPALGGTDVMAPFRRDGDAAIKRFEASGRKYDGPQVLVFDYMAVRVFPDFSSLSIVHSVQKAQSDEAVEELAEVRVPEGARVLKLLVHKADGQRLEPDAIEGKDSISLPGVTPGDYVELEYLMNEEPPAGFPGGYTGDRFYFKSFEVPFDHSEIVMALPADLKIEVDPRGAAPKTEEKLENGLRVLRFAVDESRAIKPEPNAVAAREYLPSIRVGVAATWDKFVASLREGLADRDAYDPELAAFALQIAGDAKKVKPRERLRKVYEWVLENVDDNDDLFSQAAVMMRARSGNRARVLRYLLGMVGVRAELALVRAASADNTPSTMADGDTYEHVLVRVELSGKTLWLFTSERHAPLGYVPPLLRGQPALMVDERATRTMVAPSTKDDELRHVVLDVTLAKDGSAKVEAVETVRGSGAVSWRSSLESVPEAELNQRFEEQYVARLLPGARLQKLELIGLDRSSQELELRYAFEVSALGRAVGEQWALPSLLATDLASGYAQSSQRETVELVPAPLEVDVVVRYHLPGAPPAVAASQPEVLEAAIPGRPRFSSAMRKDGDALVIERSLRLPVMRVSPQAYGVWSAFCQRVDAVEARELLVRLK